MFDTEMKRMAARMQDRLSPDLPNQQLLDFHRKTHMLYNGNLKRTKLNKEFINSVVALHNDVVKEMERRKMKHNTPLKKI